MLYDPSQTGPIMIYHYVDNLLVIGQWPGCPVIPLNLIDQ